MKTFLVAAAVAMAWLRASAQVDLELVTDQDQFLPSESLPMAVKITNRSGQRLHLGAEANWLTFNVESLGGGVVIKKAEVPVTGEFDLESSQMGTKRVDLQPYFVLNRQGRYKVTATLRIKDWSAQMASAPKNFDVISGAYLWSQEFGVPEAMIQISAGISSMNPVELATKPRAAAECAPGGKQLSVRPLVALGVMRWQSTTCWPKHAMTCATLLVVPLEPAVTMSMKPDVPLRSASANASRDA